MVDSYSETEELARSAQRRILNAALELIRDHGPEAVTTRAVAAAAAVQVPTIYRMFRDKQGLLDALAEYALARYVALKAQRAPDPDPVQELRRGWDDHAAFGLQNPALFVIMSSNLKSPAAQEGRRALVQRVRAIAQAGRLRTSEERAVAIVHACCTGVVLTLIGEGQASAGDLSLITREAILAAITTNKTDIASVPQQTAAAALRASLDQATPLSRGELALLDELLERLSR